MQEIEKKLNNDNNPVIPKFIGRPIGWTALTWALNVGRTPEELRNLPSANRMLGAISISATEIVFPATSRGFVRSIIGNDYGGKAWNDEDEGAARLFGGLVLDTLTILGAKMMYESSFTSVYDVNYALGMAATAKIGLNFLVHLIGDAVKNLDKEDK